ncbi:LysR family transcriptional regulator [[Clostridium] symbiosum]|uniref:LysR family transcriptional regulator n=1 Tax=Clostridium symbiosum TaxID=1512 RepID=UPI0006C1245A|nr:LysR family transcriptional regulator [[Clostridium] symbiosum]CUN89807.1 LysR family transcriptional regulator [[Clostridium] symbiosum]
MNIKSLEYFLILAEELNYTKASERLYITQQSLSGCIKRLKSEYGVELLQRKPVLRLTPAGEMMTFYARQILKCESQMSSGFADLSANCVGHLRVGMSRHRSNIFFPGIWNRYHTFYKNIAVTLHGSVTANMLNDIQSGILDMFVGSNVPEVRNLTIIPIAYERLWCLVHEELLKEVMPDCWQEFLRKSTCLGVDLLTLKDFPFIMFSENNQLRITINRLFSNHNILPKVILETGEHEIIYRLGCEGSGVSILSPLILYDRIRECREIPEGCHLLQINNDVSANEISLVFRNDLEQPHYADGMKNAILQEFNTYNLFINNWSR